MHPFLALGDRILLDSWRVMNAFGILAGSLVALIVLKGEIGRLRATFVVGGMIVGALFGAHLAHGLLHADVYRGDLSRVLVFWKDGHSLFGALAFCAVLLILISRILPGIPFWPTADAFSLGIPVGLLFARIGCHMKGCCWGTPIPEGHPFHGLSVKLLGNQLITLHPVQLYSAAAALGIFCILLVVRKRKTPPGLVTALFVLLYSAARFSLEFFRGDTQTHSLSSVLTLHQEICLLLFPAAVYLLILLLRPSLSPGVGGNGTI
jgi:phosphatidylglycerol:prolipoprotein diacylglycerol transferase